MQAGWITCSAKTRMLRFASEINNFSAQWHLQLSCRVCSFTGLVRITRFYSERLPWWWWWCYARTTFHSLLLLFLGIREDNYIFFFCVFYCWRRHHLDIVLLLQINDNIYLFVCCSCACFEILKSVYVLSEEEEEDVASDSYK